MIDFKQYTFFRNCISVIVLMFSLVVFSSCSEKEYYVKLQTTMGDIYLHLYNDTPKHRDNFVKLVEEGYYDGTLFHRVIADFMIQGGDPESKNATQDQQLGAGGPDYVIPAEFLPHRYHKKGALAAARDNNPEKSSSGSQFYIVEGSVVPKETLEVIEQQSASGVNGMNRITFTPEQIETYSTIGGTPFLDNNYTVFGEVVSGLDVVDAISIVPTDPRTDRPTENVVITKASLVKAKSVPK